MPVLLSEVAGLGATGRAAGGDMGNGRCLGVRWCCGVRWQVKSIGGPEFLGTSVWGGKVVVFEALLWCPLKCLGVGIELA